MNPEQSQFVPKEEREMDIKTEPAESFASEVTEQTENGVWLRREERDKTERLLREEHRSFAGDAADDADVKWHYRKVHTFEGEGTVPQSETGTDMHRENSWSKTFETDADGRLVGETGEVTEGENRGHRWSKTFIYNEAGKMVGERGKILAQGENTNKEPKGHTWEHTWK